MEHGSASKLARSTTVARRHPEGLNRFVEIFMRARFQRLSVITGFVFLCVLLLVNAAVNRHRIAIQTRAAGWVDHSRQVLFEIERAEVLFADAEAGQRGYLFTGDPRYLAPYQNAVARIGPELDKLAALSSHNPVGQRYVGQLRTLSQAKLEELARTVALARAGHPDQARSVVLSGTGVRLMDNIRDLLNSMRGEEYRLDAERQSRYLFEVHLTIESLDAATAVAVLGCMALAFIILRERALRDQHARQLREREERFRVTLTSIGDGVIATDSAGQRSPSSIPSASRYSAAPLRGCLAEHAPSPTASPSTTSTPASPPKPARRSWSRHASSASPTTPSPPPRRHA